MSVFEVRLRIDDPSGFIAFIEVATTGDLPSEPQNQTAYKVTADGNYYATDVTTGALFSDYEIQNLYVSDERIEAWIASGGEDYATCQALKNILSKIGKDLGIAKNTSGAETVEYTSLSDLYAYYKGLLAQCSSDKKSNENNNSGRIGGSKPVEIAGGNL